MQQLVTTCRRPCLIVRVSSRGISEMSNLRGGSSERTEISNPSDRGHSGSRGRATDPSRRGRGRGAKANAANPTSSAGDRPTHCRPLSILHLHDLLFPNFNSSCSSSGA